ncbi:methyl-accepting chemotaxis protein signaling domain protein [Bacteriovorax sp. BSW11_IV]|uniref:methyl-accepting chemotaxis protein n=1 Tax=Bacteriovorax sp. BSW11_IV TaxID=1353529 RepID=UPI00038A0C41|nr:methyl-accepting chemotaxis protein [Bacteriovorax sp. BSW11_IV]EQC48892.1 methyl-accepting chemotaxis protein signaling domain protein [Bacteriovorax sp. BSW11_IV]
MSLRNKMILSFILVSLIPFASGLVLAIKNSEPTVRSEIHQKLEAIQSAKVTRLKERFKGYHSAAVIFSRHRKFQDLFVDYEDALDKGKDSDEYKAVMAKNSDFLKTSATELDFGDILLVSNKGDLIAKGDNPSLNIGTNLLELNNRFSQKLKAVLDSSYAGADSIIFGDYIKLPFYNENFAFFISRFAPNSSQRGRWQKGESIGAVLLAIPTKAVNEIANELTGLGTTGETYFVGMEPDGQTYYRTNRVVKKGNIGEKRGGSSVEKAFKEQKTMDHKVKVGSTGAVEVEYFSFIKDFGLNWAVFTTQSEDEAMAAIYAIYKTALVVGLFFAVAIFIFSYYFSQSITKPILNVVARLYQGADHLKKTSSNMETQSERLSSASTQQASSLQETVASVDEISAMIERNTDASNESKDLSGKSNEVATRGKSTIEQMIFAIEDINSSNKDITDEMQHSNQQIQEIVHVIKNIGEKTKVINDIVFQTKLLSFNASVEAARAGEHGKGFAVVAEEVGNLANMSGSAATEISSMLDESIRKVESIVSMTQQKVDGLIVKGKEKVETGTRVAHECGRALDEILSNVRLVNDKVAEIAQASVEQSQGVQEINDAMRQLDEVAHVNSSIANESAGNVRILKNEAVELNSIVEELNNIVTNRRKAA